MRPRQWPTNLLVFAAPGAAGVLWHSSVFLDTLAAFGLFVLVSSGIYLLNDAFDAEQDRLHPVKRLRPVASGELSPSLAAAVGACMTVLAVVGGFAISGGLFGAYVLTYVGISVAYSVSLKRIPGLELVLVSAGFVLRAVAGGAAVHIDISPWFLTVTSALSLLIAAGKRSAELSLLGRTGTDHRAVLGAYNERFLRAVRLATGLAAAAGYGLWAFGRASLLDAQRSGGDDLLLKLSVIPFVALLVVLEIHMERGEGGAPEELALKSRGLQCFGIACVALIGAGIYL
jgi:decaprenyl-phosphate phosphoribosyltransferase